MNRTPDCHVCQEHKSNKIILYKPLDDLNSFNKVTPWRVWNLLNALASWGLRLSDIQVLPSFTTKNVQFTSSPMNGHTAMPGGLDLVCRPGRRAPISLKSVLVLRPWKAKTAKMTFVTFFLGLQLLRPWLPRTLISETRTESQTNKLVKLGGHRFRTKS